MLKIFNLNSSTKTEFIDITDIIVESVRQSNIESGLCIIYVPHTTAGVFINENADPDVMYDLRNYLDRAIPWIENYKHVEGNAAAHIKSVLTGNSISIPIENGKLVLGTWQGIFFAEYDGPRNRKFYIKLIQG